MFNMYTFIYIWASKKKALCGFDVKMQQQDRPIYCSYTNISKNDLMNSEKPHHAEKKIICLSGRKFWFILFTMCIYYAYRYNIIIILFHSKVCIVTGMIASDITSELLWFQSWGCNAWHGTMLFKDLTVQHLFTLG